MPIEIAVSGACGKTGARVCALALQDSAYRLVYAIERAGHPLMGRDVGEAVGLPPTGIKICDRLPAKTGVLIDFSAPASVAMRVEECAGTGTALLVGTTGLDEPLRARILDASRKIPCLVAANMSVGANLLAHLAAEAAKSLGGAYDIEIVETHHRSKKDSPSGTALKIAEAVAGASGRTTQDLVFGRGRGSEPRKAREIAIHAVRAGDIVGDHTVLISGPGERLELTHRAHSRDVFA
ncbi:MAG: 4-hydroxy-tetrahydrodipicolinate reductase, partial [Planctomycetota bacterium]|nr:4-hydroxy-tetrahydrodipicolinate reductase [Planctomycetota bacterium]